MARGWLRSPEPWWEAEWTSRPELSQSMVNDEINDEKVVEMETNRGHRNREGAGGCLRGNEALIQALYTGRQNQLVGCQGVPVPPPTPADPSTCCSTALCSPVPWGG